MKRYKPRGENLTDRRVQARLRLHAQINKGTKNTRDGIVPLTEKDKTRINLEIKVLKERT